MLIIDMPMPRGCAECPLKTFGGACSIPVFGNGVNYKPFEERPDWCPIKGVLPDEHGDLIDREILLQTFQNADYETYNDYCEAFDTVESAEIVIAAERKDDEQIH